LDKTASSVSSQRNYLILTLLQHAQRFVLSRGLQSLVSLLKLSLALYQNKKSSILKDWVGNKFSPYLSKWYTLCWN